MYHHNRFTAYLLLFMLISIFFYQTPVNVDGGAENPSEWSNEIKLNLVDIRCEFPSIAVSNDTVYVTWADFRHYYLEDSAILKNESATRKNILTELWFTFRDATKDDISIFYWAGHGSSKNNTFHILPVDYKEKGKISVNEWA